MQDRRIAWKEAAQVFLLGRAGRGYADKANTAFFPLWPLLQHIGGLLPGGAYPDSYYIAGLLLSNLCFYIVLALLYELIAADFDACTARRALFYLSFAPYALFFFAGYTESLFLLLCVATFLVLRRGGARDWWFAGILGFLPSLTRSSGVALAITYLVLYIQRFWVPSQRLQIPLHYALFSLVLAALSLSFPIETDSPLLSQPRYLLMLFPVAVIAALWGKNRRFHRGYLALSTGCFLTFTILFVCGLWVA